EVVAATNLGPFGAFRGPGYVQGTFTLERALDELAEKLAIGPLELRRKNFAAEDQDAGDAVTANHLLECYARGAKAIGWDRRADLRPDGHLRRGLGCAAAVWGGGGGPPAYAEVRVFGGDHPQAVVTTGGQDIGTGTRTALA